MSYGNLVDFNPCLSDVFSWEELQLLYGAWYTRHLLFDAQFAFGVRRFPSFHKPVSFEVFVAGGGIDSARYWLDRIGCLLCRNEELNIPLLVIGRKWDRMLVSSRAERVEGVEFIFDKGRVRKMDGMETKVDIIDDNGYAWSLLLKRPITGEANAKHVIDRFRYIIGHTNGMGYSFTERMEIVKDYVL